MRFKPGQVLYGSRRTYLRKVAVAEFEGICANTTYVLEPKDPSVLLPDFLPFVMSTETFHEHSIKQSKGSVNPYINFSDIEWYEFPLPPVDEQRRIADLLWAGDDTITEYTNAVTSLEKLRAAYWQDVREKNEYPLVRLREITAIATGSTPHRGTKEYWEDGTIPWLPTQKVNEKMIRQADEFITEKAFKECSMKLFSADSILVALYGEGKTRGSVAYLTFDACINQAFAAVKPTERVDSWFLYHCLDNSYSDLRGFSQGSSQKNLNAQLLGQFKIPLPDKTEQVDISEKLNDLSNRISDIFAHIEILKALKKNLLSTLLIG
jgi:type I restriction enzyme S subunit